MERALRLRLDAIIGLLLFVILLLASLIDATLGGAAFIGILIGVVMWMAAASSSPVAD